MNRLTRKYIAIPVVLFIFSFIAISSYGQIRYGPKIAIQTYVPMYSEAVLPDSISVVPQLWFNLGVAMDYAITKRFSFYTEVVYSRRGKTLKGGIKDMFKHVAHYNYIDIPVMLRLNYKGSTNRGDFAWYVGMGGFFSYWMSGNGTINSFELDELNLPEIAYKIGFNQTDQAAIDDKYILYLKEPNRIQAGLTAEAGVGFNFKRKQHILVSLRYTYRQSWLARDFNVDVGLGEYKEDFRTLEHILSLNASWLFEWNIGEGKKGKSTVKKRPKS